MLLHSYFVIGQAQKMEVGGSLTVAVFPCGFCGLPVADTYPAVFCDYCKLGQHCACKTTTLSTVTIPSGSAQPASPATVLLTTPPSMLTPLFLLNPHLLKLPCISTMANRYPYTTLTAETCYLR